VVCSEPASFGSNFGMSIPSLRPWLLALGCLLCALPAGAQELDDQTRSAARELATEGSALYQQSDFEGAYDRFNRAFQLVQKPNVGIWAARSLVRAGRWVEASERYLELERMTLPEGAPADQIQAVQDAAKERRELLGRVPSLKIVVEGADPSSVFVSINGQLVKPALIGVKQPVNPGKLQVKGVRGEQVVQQAVELGEAQSREVKLSFTPAGAATPAPPSPPAPPAPSTARSDGATWRLLGFIGVGVGGAALATGAVFGGLAAADKSDLDAGCPNRQCGPAYHDQNDAYGTKKTIASVGIIGGAVLAGAGAVLLFTVPSSQPAQGRNLELRGYVSASGAGLVGAF
jgi:hypothetical protein